MLFQELKHSWEANLDLTDPMLELLVRRAAPVLSLSVSSELSPSPSRTKTEKLFNYQENG